MKLYTIGFTKKDAKTFFSLIKEHGIQRVVDIRLNPNGQLSGFSKKSDISFFLKNLADGCEYVHLDILAPTKDILKEFRTKKDWDKYVIHFEMLMNERNIPETLKKHDFEEVINCLLCSEATPEQCHRRLVAEKLAASWPEVEVIHL